MSPLQQKALRAIFEELRGVKVGSPIPSERHLAEHADVTRTVIRGLMASLAKDGVIRCKGRNWVLYTPIKPSLLNQASENPVSRRQQVKDYLMSELGRGRLQPGQGITELAIAKKPGEDEKPRRRWLAYGSSITNVGSWYVHHAALRLLADVFNKGMCGSCLCEPEVAGWLPSCESWDFATLELGVNMRGGFSAMEFEKRARFDRTIRKGFLGSLACFDDGRHRAGAQDNGQQPRGKRPPAVEEDADEYGEAGNSQTDDRNMIQRQMQVGGCKECLHAERLTSGQLVHKSEARQCWTRRRSWGRYSIMSNGQGTAGNVIASLAPARHAF